MTLLTHLATGATTVARCWALSRRDGLALGFTDHDRPLAFEGLTFRPDSGLSARAVVQATGLSVDNSEALGVLSSDAISEPDIDAGRWDGAEVRLWHVNWTDVAERRLSFRGTLGEIRREGAAFHVELRGLTEALNRPLGRLYQKTCSAALGDAACRVDSPALASTVAAGTTDGRSFRFPSLAGKPPSWFEGGRLTVLDGAGQGLTATVRSDRLEGATRVLDLWSPLRATLAPADRIRLEPGCDKRAETCRARFANLANFQGFPFIPGEDWLFSVPMASGRNDGGPLQ